MSATAENVEIARLKELDEINRDPHEDGIVGQTLMWVAQLGEWAAEPETRSAAWILDEEAVLVK